MSGRTPLRRWLLHGLAFALPLCVLVYVWSGPHPAWAALPWLALVIGCIGVDLFAGPERTQPEPELPAWPFDATLYVLVAIQLANVAGLAWLVRQVGYFSVDGLTAVFLVGTSSGYSAIVVAHELIHRRKGHLRQLGRLLLVTVLYEHFYTEHIRGHHVRVATGEDPATARFGERLGPFLRRTVPGQLASAWDLEAKRIGRPAAISPRWLRSRVVQGLLAGWGLWAAVGLALGPSVALAWLHQAALAVLLLECVNYIEHWGLTRAEKRVQTVDSWDTESWFSYYSLVGLTRHADHHAHASRPYEQLRHFDESPKMPHGYWGGVVRAIFDNERLIARLDAELRAKRLGPYAPEVVAE